MKSSGIKSLIERALKAHGLVRPLNKDKEERRRDWKGAHGLRKFYQTTAEKVMKSINVITMGRSIGITASYYKSGEKEVLSDYLKAVDILTISQNNTILDKKVKELQEQNKTIAYFIKGKLQEKDEEIIRFKKDHDLTNDAFAVLSNKVSKLIEEIELLIKSLKGIFFMINN